MDTSVLQCRHCVVKILSPVGYSTSCLFKHENLWFTLKGRGAHSLVSTAAMNEWHQSSSFISFNLHENLTGHQSDQTPLQKQSEGTIQHWQGESDVTQQSLINSSDNMGPDGSFPLG